MVIPGHGTSRVGTLRLWKATARRTSTCTRSTAATTSGRREVKNEFENISWVLYPNDSTPSGRELRLRQEYFFVSASLQDLLGRHLLEHGRLDNLADQVAVHLNDTHRRSASPS